MFENIEVHANVEKVKFETEEDHDGYRYSDDTEFTSPIVIRGTSKQLVPNPNVLKMKKVDSDTYTNLMASLKQYEDTFKDITVESPAKLNLVSFNATGFVCRIEIKDQPAPLYLLIKGTEGAAIKQLSKILGVPYSYAKKSPGDLNQKNFDFWTAELAKTHDTPLRVVYATNESKVCEIPVERVIPGSDPVAYEKVLEQVVAYPVVTLFKAKQKKEKGITSLVETPLNHAVPFLSNLMDKVTEGINAVEPLPLLVNQAAFGYTGENGGDHHLRLLVDKPDMFVKIGEEEFRPMLSLYSNFDGSKSGFGDVKLVLGFMRLACSNGMVVPMREEQNSQIQERWIMQRMAELKVDEANPRYQSVLKSARKRAKRLFSNFSLTLKLGTVMAGLGATEFPNVLRDFFTAKGNFEASLQEMNTEFVDLREEEFVDVLDTLGRKCGIKEAAVRFTVMEYLKGMEQDKTSPFKTPMDVINFLTFIGKAWDTETQRKIEAVSITLGLSLASALIKKQSHRNELLNKYKSAMK